MINRRIFERPCRRCKGPFVGNRKLKYCGPVCREAAAKAQRTAYERREKRLPYAKRKQLELPLDDVRKDAYKEAP